LEVYFQFRGKKTKVGSELPIKVKMEKIGSLLPI